jgi:superfamily II DNA or RNA helicase
MAADPESRAILLAENARLAALLDAHGIEWRIADQATPQDAREPATGHAVFNADEKIAMFRRLFGGRTDIYPVRWENKAGKSGYAPACANEWKPGVCEKPRIKCSECPNRKFLPLTDQVIYDHLTGRHVIGVYPLLADDTCRFLAVDFDEAQWREDATAFIHSCRDLEVPAALEISRSGNGAHAWIFFASPLAARDARRLGSAIISHACARTHQLKLSSYDRLFPNQDTMPKGGFGNLIALPLQKQARAEDRSVFVDDEFMPWPDQWAFLAAVRPVSPADLEPILLRATGGAHPLDVEEVVDDEASTPWKRRSPVDTKIPGDLPTSLTLTLANLVYVEKSALTPPLANRLIRLAAFQNPDFYKAQAMRFPVWDKPRIIGCAENHPRHIALPRGCLDAAMTLLRSNGIECLLQDERFAGTPLDVSFHGSLRPDQEAALAALLDHDDGVLCAPTAFGKTVTAAALIARRRVNTLVLVHRTELLRQWKERLQSFLGVGKDVVGVVGGGKAKPTGLVDIAVMQSISRKGEINALVEGYGQVIVDECHHLSALSFELILKRIRARYVHGLTATPQRRDGQHPIIFMQCGPIRHIAARQENAPSLLEVVPLSRPDRIEVAETAGIQEVFLHLASDPDRTTAIANQVEQAVLQGRKVLVLTERFDHLASIESELQGKIPNLFSLHGRLSKKTRGALIDALNALAPDSPRALLATGKLVGEGFDHPPLDTLVLAMPISWKGTLQQYAGRLHREHAGKVGVRILDFVDTGHPALLRMWAKRQRGYRSMGYQIADPIASGKPTAEA